MTSTVKLKARLLALHKVQIKTSPAWSDGAWNPFGQEYIFVKLGRQNRVRLLIAEDGPLALRREEDGQLLLEMGTKVLLEDVELERPIFHCPDQISVCLYYECQKSCRFCPLPRSLGHPFPSKEQILGLITDNIGSLQGIAFTHAIPIGKTAAEVIDEMIEIMREIRQLFGSDIPLGVSPFACNRETLKRLRDAGANELRVNLETFNKDLFRKLCPGKDQETILKCLSDGVDIFGRNRVSSNIILGIGEDDSDVIDGITALARTGVVSTLHPFSPFASWETKMRAVREKSVGRPSAQRLLHLASAQKAILSEHELSFRQFKTTCPGCNACALTPFADL